MSDFTEVVKMLTDTMNAQLSIIKDQEKNSAESTRLNNQAINRQLDIINDQNGFLKKYSITGKVEMIRKYLRL